MKAFRYVIPFLAAFSLLIVCSGCGMKQNHNNKSYQKTEEITYSEDLSNAVAKLSWVKKATALKRGDNAYIAVMVERKSTNGKLTDDMKAMVSKRVKATNSAIKDVYVSANPDLKKQFDEFTSSARSGKPIQGMIKNTNDAIKRTFPQER